MYICLNNQKLDTMDYKLFNTIDEKFTIHLIPKDNERILYSGKFGVGKSTFLRYYFKDNEKYNCIHLYPVNYSILSNEDIFTYLKFDILFDLITNQNIELKEAEKYGFDVAMPFFAKNNWFRFLTLLPLLFDKLGGVIPGRGISEVMKGCEQLLKDYKKFTNPEDGDLDEFQRFQADIFNKEGGLYESNSLTNIIRTELAEIKPNKGKENILIIDDLDRLDPDHIFRLLNVFSAHFDERNRFEGENSSNKYGFDKIILVCDNENIRNIFKARYGIDTDYNGYIDKFYSKEVFEHKVCDLVNIFSKKLFTKVKTGHQDLVNNDSSNFFAPYLNSIIEILLAQNLLNLRALFKFASADIDLTGFNTMYDPVNGISRYSLFTLVILDVLSVVYGDKNNLELIVEKININHRMKDDYDFNQSKRVIFGELIYLNGEITGRWEWKGSNDSESTYQLQNQDFQVFKTYYSDRSTSIYIDQQISQSLDLNYLALFKKYALEKYR